MGSGSTHSFIFIPFVTQARFKLELLLHVLFVSTPAQIDLVFKDRVKDSQVIVVDRTLNVNLIVVNMTELDVVLDMN